MKLLIPILVSGSIAAASEISVFGAGDLNSANPYGLTKEEKLILENKKEIQTVLQKSSAQNEKVQSVAERIDGLQGIIEGLTQQVHEHSLLHQKIQERENLDSNSSQVDINSQAIIQIKELLEEVSTVVDEINDNYVTKEQFAALIKELKLKTTIDSAKKSDTPKSIDKLSNSELEKEADKLFKAKKYSEAQKYYNQLVQKKHKSAYALYMLGETAYEQKDYSGAVARYKQSASADEKAGYMPTLLLHSGVSMEKTGDKASAKAFYQAVINSYGSSGAAKEAQNYLSKLK